MIILPLQPSKKLFNELSSLMKKHKDLEFMFTGFKEINDKVISERFFLIEKRLFNTIPRELEKIKSNNFDLSIDLNSEFYAPAALLGLKCSISKRIGFSDNFKSPFYSMIYKGNSIVEFIEFLEGLRN